MRTLLFTIALLSVSVLLAQKSSEYPKVTFRIDTLLFLKDTSNLFVQEVWDTTVVKTYYCSADSVDETFHYGFLRLKKGRTREYRVKNIRDVKLYPRPAKYEGLRGHDGIPVTILRLK